MYFYKYSKYKPSNTTICENYINLLEFLKTIYQNVQISEEKLDLLFHFIGCLLARVIRSKLIPFQLDHPVVVLVYFTNISVNILPHNIAMDIFKINVERAVQR